MKQEDFKLGVVFKIGDDRTATIAEVDYVSEAGSVWAKELDTYMRETGVRTRLKFTRSSVYFTAWVGMFIMKSAAIPLSSISIVEPSIPKENVEAIKA